MSGESYGNRLENAGESLGNPLGFLGRNYPISSKDSVGNPGETWEESGGVLVGFVRERWGIRRRIAGGSWGISEGIS